MSDLCKEHRPLLCEDTDEDLLQFTPNQRRHNMGYRGRAKNNIKGAAKIIKNWPDHLSSSVTYWWIGLGMFGLTTFIVYNSVLSYALLSNADAKPMSGDPMMDRPIQKRYLLDVFMHIFVNNEKEANLNKFLPYVEIIANDYLQYKFNLVVLFNDTTQEDKTTHQAEINNEDALNSLWTANNVHEPKSTPGKKKSNINIQYNNLSTYLNSSPLQKYWKRLPYQFIEFLVRAVSIWDKGGIVFNPLILTPKSPHSAYIEKLQNILLTFQEVPKLNVAKTIEYNAQNTEHKTNRNGYHIPPNHERKNNKRVNNIRDIIDALEIDTGLESQSLSEAENREDSTKVEIKPPYNELNAISNADNASFTTGNVYKHLQNDNLAKSIVDTENNLPQMNATDKAHLLPSFIDFLFREGPKIALHKRDSRNVSTKKHVTKRNSRTIPNDLINKMEENNKIIQPMIIPPPKSFDKSKIEEVKDEVLSHYEGEDKLTIDLKGNLMATKIPCHAFIGSVFSNVKHHNEEESLKDFVISELSQFCKGLLSTCKGVEVILL